jgi:hypothetical protein
MGDLNNIQDEINAEMYGDLADVSFPYIGNREDDSEFDPENPRPTTTPYEWKGIFGLQFTVRDTETFKIEQNDQKGIVFMRDGDLNIPFAPELQEVIVVRGESFIIIDMLVLPADNGWTLQMRKLG